MANSSSNNTTDDEEKKKKQRTREEALVLQGFMLATQRRVEEFRLKMSGTQDIELSDGEKRILNNIHSAGMMEGIIAGITTFVFLRRFPRYLAKRAAQAQQHRSAAGGYKLEQPPSGKVHSPFQNTGGAGGSQPTAESYDAVNRGGILWRAFQFTLDTTISFLVAANVSYYMADTEKIKKSVAEIPLMEGRSGISDNFCPILVEEYKRQWNLDPNNSSSVSIENSTNKNNKEPLPPFDRKEILKDPQIGLLQGYVEFIRNCQKRQAMERRIRQERGMRPNEPVAIPSPGVSSISGDGGNDWGTTINDDENNNNTFSTEDDFLNGETQFNGDDNEEWTKEDAASFVSDREDPKK